MTGVRIDGAGMTVTGPEGVVFENVDVRVEPGSLAVVVGESGTGKTALLLAVSGRLPLTAGRLEVGGQVLPAQAAAVRKLVRPARLRPGLELEPKLRVREVITEARLVSGVGTRALAEARALAGVEPDESALVGELPAVEQLLLAVALAVATRPRGIVVDDVEFGLVPPDRGRAWRALATVAGTGITVLAAATEAPPLATRIVLTHEHEDPPELPFFAGLTGARGDDDR